MKRLTCISAFAALLSAGAAQAAPLTITKTAAIVSDPINLTAYKAIPGAVIDYTLLVRNPNTLTVFRAVAVSDSITSTGIPQGAEYYVGTASNVNPVVYSDGSLLGLGLGGSGLGFNYTSWTSSTDSVDFSCDNGTTWTCTLHPDVDGYDPAVTNIRVSPSGNFAANSAFSVVIRVRVRK